ncbi:class V myosin, partial [Hortaea werneckii]
SCAGYPTRWTYEEFALRYYMLISSQQWTTEIRDMANAILSKALGEGKNDGTDKYQLGLTKIFFRAGMLAFLENLRSNRLNDAAIMIQKNLRAKYWRRRYLEATDSVKAFQALCRAFVARERTEELRRQKGATTIQRVWRGQKERKNFLRIRNDLIIFEATSKGYLLRKHLLDKRLGDAARCIQRTWRSHNQLKNWRDYRRKVVIAQSLWRGKTDRKTYRKLREEARDLKQISYRLENKVVELTQNLGTMRTENRTLKGQVQNYESQLKSWRERHNALEARANELQREANQAGINAAKLSAMETDMQRLQAAFDESTTNMRKLQDEEKALRENLRVTSQELETTRQSKTASESEKLSLRQQLADMQDQL